MKKLILLCLLPLSAWAQSPPAPTPHKAKDKSIEEPLGSIKNWQKPNEEIKLSLPVTKFQLENGMTVLLLEDHTVPMISYHTWYKVGSRDESPGITGAAHMLEHMMFKGGKEYSGKDFDRIMNENGIEHNAFTTFDYTGFYQNLPSSKLELMMDVEVDRMSALALKPQDLISERDVVKEERRWRVDNNPRGLLFESTMGQIFRKSPYRWPVIGTMADITNFNEKTLREFYDTFYVPNNAILVIAGSFNTEEVKKLVKKYYAKLPKKPLPERTYPEEPPQTKQYNAFVRQEVQNISFNVAFQGLPQGDPDMYALDLASYILGAGTSSRLHKRLVYKSQLATSASAYHYSMAGDGIFNVGVSLKPGIHQEKALQLVYNEIYRLRVQKVSEDELKKAKTLAMKSFVDALTTIDGKARALAATEIMTGSYENLFTDLEKYNKVTAEDIKRVAEKTLNPQQRTIVVLEPKAKAGL